MESQDAEFGKARRGLMLARSWLNLVGNLASMVANWALRGHSRFTNTVDEWPTGGVTPELSLERRNVASKSAFIQRLAAQECCSWSVAGCAMLGCLAAASLGGICWGEFFPVVSTGDPTLLILRNC